MLGLAVPAQVLMVPSYLLMSKLHLINNLASLMIVYVSTALSFSIFILSGFFKTIPYEVEEAAAIDGCNPFQIFSKVIMPLGKPALSTIMIFNLLTIWNDFYNPLLYIRDDRLKTVTLGLTNYMGRYVANYPTMFAAVLLASLPVIIVFIILQKQFVSGITAGSLKG
jgi:raffinose/stachyose/melibiose transport system permease protein